MSYKISSKLVYFAALALSASAYANLVVSTNTTGGQWYKPTTATEASGAYWDQKSIDGKNCNIGFYLQQTTAWDASGVSNCTSASFNPGSKGPGELAYFGGATAGTATGWEFESANNNTLNALTLKLEVTSRSSLTEFGWVDKNGVDTPLFVGSDSASTNPVKVINVPNGDRFSFYFCVQPNCASNQKYYSKFPLNGAGTTGRDGKFALFSESPNDEAALNSGAQVRQYWIGIEDGRGIFDPENRGDYNDFVISATVVPEPGFYGALSLGLGGLFMLVRRRRQA